MKALVGYAALFIAIGIILGCYIEGFIRFVIVLSLLISAYVLLCKRC